MTDALGILGWGFWIAYVTWLFYLAAMSLIRARSEKRISKTALVLGYPVVAVGLAFDCVLNVVVCSVLFLEPPRELLLTKRLSRLIRTDSKWRGSLAAWVCAELLDTFDPSGRHCAEPKWEK